MTDIEALDEAEVEVEDNETVMSSLLASYYGIQEGSANQASDRGHEMSQSELIDTPHFDPNKYFKVI